MKLNFRLLMLIVVLLVLPLSACAPAAAPEEEEIPDNPTIVAETKVDVPNANVADAVMMLDLRNTNALLFKNSGTGELNMVYRREDGNIGWVEPHES